MAEGTMPDFTRCQSEIRDPHSAFRLGPRPEPRRCDALSEYLVFEVKPGADGMQGSMCLCCSCADTLFQQCSRNVAKTYQFLDLHKTAERYER